MHELDPAAPAGRRYLIRVDGSIESLARLMVAVGVALSGSWAERSDQARGAHYVLEGSPHDLIARVDLAPSAIELDLLGFGAAAAVVAELAQRLRSQLAPGAD
jgi:hypothetical protein